MSRKLVTVIVPMFNEAAGLEALVGRLQPVLNRLGLRWEILFVDDGSTDDTLDRLKALNRRDRRFTSISLSRNFGKDIALAAGLRYARGDAAVLIDADLQHPPELIEDFVAKWREGFQIVYGQRWEDEGARPFLRRLLSGIFHKFFSALANTNIPFGAGDFRLLDRRAINAMNDLSEVSRYSQGLYSWIGFRTIGVPYVVGKRAAGATSWRLRHLIRFGLDGITSFSTLPLRIWSLLGLVISLVALGYALIVFTETLIFGRDVPGYPTIVISIMIFAGVQLISLGVMGEYLGRIYEQVKGRPLFLVADEVGQAREEVGPSPVVAPKTYPGTLRGSVREAHRAAQDSPI